MSIHQINHNNNPSLYGIDFSNRKQSDLWSKNNFNSSFPVALACYMRDHNQSAVYLSLVEKEKNLVVESSELSFSDIFNTTCKNSDLAFLFESKYGPYQTIAGNGNDIKGIDVVVAEYAKNGLNQRILNPVRPLEIKLTVVPDNSTCRGDESEWCSELVIRAATTKYCGLGILESLEKAKLSNPNIMKEVNEILYEACNTFSNRPSTAWPDQNVVHLKREAILATLNEFEKKYLHIQKPLLMQPIWRTKGKKPYFHQDGVFDIFVWSDLAFTRLFLDDALTPDNNNEEINISRRMRSAARLIRLLYEYSSSKTLNLNEIYNQMAYSQQTDKEFAVSGRNLHKYMQSNRLAKPTYKTDILDEIIIDKGQDILNLLSPERRFDQSVMFTHKDKEIERLNEIINNLSNE